MINYVSYNIIIYEGDFAFGKFEGYGKKYEKDGNYYIGQFMNNQKHGKGTGYSKDKKLYTKVNLDLINMREKEN